MLEDDDVTDTFIRAVAAEVKGHGPLYEKALKEREKNNSKYGFALQKDVCEPCSHIVPLLMALLASSTCVLPRPFGIGNLQPG